MESYEYSCIYVHGLGPELPMGSDQMVVVSCLYVSCSFMVSIFFDTNGQAESANNANEVISNAQRLTDQDLIRYPATNS